MSTNPSVPSQPSPAPATVATPRASRSFTRLAAAWWALVVGLLILIVLLVFVAQNTDSVTVHFLMLHWNLPVGVGYLLAAVAGATITVLVGAARMIQLRRAAKKNLTPL
ncbi:LapA family protein [Mycobacterium sp. 050134]|uniref:LapA family protein n=1 Tax=Mycobacterium sp. 050134 TaxID=3096111 RepID=UPI002ED92533